MTRSADDITGALRAFVPGPDGADNCHALNEMLEGFAGLTDPARVLSPLFAVLERFPSADFGTPAPLVRQLETLPGYAERLAGSLERQPTELAAWMANRLLNTTQPREDRAAWLQRLTEVAGHPLAARPLRETAIRFLDFQASRSGRGG